MNPERNAPAFARPNVRQDMENAKNYIITLSVQFGTDAEALAKAAEIAKDSGEIAYLKHGTRDLGFSTEQGDYGAPKIQSA